VDASPAWLQVLRDMSIVLLAFETIVIGILVGVLVVLVLRLVQLVRGYTVRYNTTAQEILGNVKDTTQTAAETAKTAQTTVTYVGDRTAKPVIELYSAVAGARRFVGALFSPNRNRRPGEDDGRE
jgi:hypothetical protein